MSRAARAPPLNLLGTGHKVKGGGGGIIYLVSALLVAHPLIVAQKFVPTLKLVFEKL